MYDSIAIFATFETFEGVCFRHRSGSRMLAGIALCARHRLAPTQFSTESRRTPRKATTTGSSPHTISIIADEACPRRPTITAKLKDADATMMAMYWVRDSRGCRDKVMVVSGDSSVKNHRGRKPQTILISVDPPKVFLGCRLIGFANENPSLFQRHGQAVEPLNSLKAFLDA